MYHLFFLVQLNLINVRKINIYFFQSDIFLFYIFSYSSIFSIFKWKLSTEKNKHEESIWMINESVVLLKSVIEAEKSFVFSQSHKSFCHKNNLINIRMWLLTWILIFWTEINLYMIWIRWKVDWYENWSKKWYCEFFSKFEYKMRIDGKFHITKRNLKWKNELKKWI